MKKEKEKIIKCFDLRDPEVRKRMLKYHGNLNEIKNEQANQKKRRLN